MKLTVLMDGDTAHEEYLALKVLLQSGTVEDMEIKAKGMGGPIGDRLRLCDEFKQVRVKETTK